MLGALVLAVPVFEEGKIVVARWMSFFGRPVHFETPVLDAVGWYLNRTRDAVAVQIASLFHDPAWKVGPTLMLAAVWVVMLLFLLKGMKR